MSTAITINSKYQSQLQEFVESLAADAPLPADATVLHDGRNLVWRATVNGIDLVVKQFRTITVANRFIYAHLRPSKARRSYDNALRLMQTGFHTPEPLAWGDVCRGGLLRDSFYVCRHVEGVPMTGWHSDPDAPLRLHQLATLMARMHESGVCHRDFNAANILRTADDAFHLIDLNRMKWGDITMRDIGHNFYQLYDGTNADALHDLAQTYATMRALPHPEQFLHRVTHIATHTSRFKCLKRSLKRLVMSCYVL